MGTNRIVGIILIVIGIFGLAYQSLSFTTQHKAVDLGPLQVTTEKTHTLPIPPILGGIALVGGIALLIAGGKRG